MPPVISDQDAIELVKKDFQRKLKSYYKKNNIKDKEDDRAAEEDDDQKDDIKKEKPKVIDFSKIKSGIRLKHKDSGLEYYVSGIDSQQKTAELETPEGHFFSIPEKDLESDYELG